MNSPTKNLSHSEKVALLCEKIKKFSSGSSGFKIVKDEVSHFVPNPENKNIKRENLSIKGLNNIISIDPVSKICIAEPGVPFCKLAEETLKFGLIPYTVPELKTITLGGAVSGCSVESMSYKYGGFHDSCLEYEVVTGRGEVIECSPESNSDIFDMIHGSYGTLGVITKIKFKLMAAKPFVKMEYISFNSFDNFWSFLKEKCLAKSYDFIDAIIHGPEKFVACCGNMVDSAPYTSSYKWLNIFYKSTTERNEDYLITLDYFFRYDTECHWLTKTVPLMETRPARLLLGKFILGSTNLIKWSKKLSSVMKLKKRPEVVVDVFIPSKNFKKFFKWYESSFAFYPLWIVPYSAPKIYPWINDEHAKKMEGSFFIDCAVYGKKNSDPKVDYSEVLEKKTVELNGIKTLISRNHFNEKEFWGVYNKKNFDTIKAKTDPKNLFKGVFEKMVRSTALIATLMLAPLTLFAGNSNSNFLGDDAAITAGSINAVTRNSEAIWYNPAGLGGNEYSRLTLSGTVFSLHLQKIPDATTTILPSGTVNDGLSANEYLIIPASVTFMRKATDEISWGIGVYVPQYQDVSFNSSIASVENFAGFATPVNYEQGVNVDQVNSGYQLGGAFGYEFNDRFRLGAGLFGLYNKFRYNSSLFENLESTDGSGTISAFYVDTARELLSSLGIRATVGAQWQVSDDIHLGLMVYSPAFQIASWGQVTASAGAAGYDDLGNRTVSAVRFNRDIKEWDGSMIVPFRTQIAFAIKRPEFWVGLTGDIYTPLKNNDLLIDKKLNWNMSIGTKYWLSEKLALGGGFFTDNSDHKDPENFGDAKVNYYGATFGIDFRTAIAREHDANQNPVIFGTVLAGRYAYGVGEVGGLVFDPTTDLNIANARTVPTDVSFQELSLYLGTSLYF